MFEHLMATQATMLVITHWFYEKSKNLLLFLLNPGFNC